jgi:hypothetical protein
MPLRAFTTPFTDIDMNNKITPYNFNTFVYSEDSEVVVKITL